MQKAKWYKMDRIWIVYYMDRVEYLILISLERFSNEENSLKVNKSSNY